MAVAPTNIAAENSGHTVVGVPRRRGKSKTPNFVYDGPIAVIRLELDLSDDQTRRRVQAQWEAVFRLRRALQRDAATRCRAYWAAHRERAADPKIARGRLGLSRKGIEDAAKRHIDAAGWMRAHLTKAVGLHVADEVWQTIDRHLFADNSGRRNGAPRVGNWWDFTRIPGRARSHTKDRPVWETWRLVGTLDGHLNTYRHKGLPVEVDCRAVATMSPAGTSVLAQPTRMPIPVKVDGRSWWDHAGAFAVVFTGLPTGDLVLPVRLPQGAGQWPHLHHFLGDPTIWHKIDMVRVADRKAAGGWRYYAHLLVHRGGYQSESTRQRRAAQPTQRRAGLDTNVSNLSVASWSSTDPEELRIEQVVCTTGQQRAAAQAAANTRDRQRALDRSRRNSNPGQYSPSVRQQKRAQRRASAQLPPRQITNPGGARHARTDGRPTRTYRRDELSGRYRAIRADHVAQARSASQAKQARAADVAARIVAVHGNSITVEDCHISTWARRWGKRISLFSPGILLAAIARECHAAGGKLQRAGTRTTAMSQHCLCGARVSKTLAQRTHRCPACGLVVDRDVVSAVLASCVEFADPDDPSTAGVNYQLARALGVGLASQQEWEGSVNRNQPPTPVDGARSARAGSHPTVASAEQAAPGPPPNRPGSTSGRHGTSRKQPGPKLIGAA